MPLQSDSSFSQSKLSPLQGESSSAFLPSSTFPLTLTSIRVKRGRLRAEILVDARVRTSTPELAARLLEAYPGLRAHACLNDEGVSFTQVLLHTPLPHVLEHLVIEHMRISTPQVRPLTDNMFVGISEWIDEDAGTASIEVNFVDDHQALQALSAAVATLNREVVSLNL